MKIVKLIFSILIGIVIVSALVGLCYEIAKLITIYPDQAIYVLFGLLILGLGGVLGYAIYDNFFNEDNGDKYDY